MKKSFLMCLLGSIIVSGALAQEEIDVIALATHGAITEKTPGVHKLTPEEASRVLGGWRYPSEYTIGSWNNSYTGVGSYYYNLNQSSKNPLAQQFGKQCWGGGLICRYLR